MSPEFRKSVRAARLRNVHNGVHARRRNTSRAGVMLKAVQFATISADVAL